MPAHSHTVKHRAKHKQIKPSTSRRKLCKLTEIEEPVIWIRDIERSTKSKRCTKSILKPAVKKQLDITQTLDALQNEIVSKRHQRQSAASSASTSSSGKKKPGRLSFNNVSVYYFNRALGQSTIPSDGANPLGMDMKHVEHQKMKVSLYNSIQTESRRATRQKTELARLNAMNHKQKRRTSNTFSLPPPPPPLPTSSTPATPSTSATSTISGSDLSFDNNNIGASERARVRDGLFQQLCSVPGPRRMLSSSAVSKLRKSPHFQRNLPASYLASRPEFPWQPVSLAAAFSTQLRVEDIVDTLPKPSDRLLSDFTSHCSQSFNNYHKSRQSLTEEEEEQQKLPPETSPPYSRLHLRRSKRRLETEVGGVRPLSARDRQVLLRSQGVAGSDREAGGEITDIQTSRQTSSGCSCSDGCLSDCECSRNNISCQLEHAGFPCSCLATCSNPNGRRVFDNVAVALHFINTMFNVEGVMDISASDHSHSPPAKRRKRK